MAPVALQQAASLLAEQKTSLDYDHFPAESQCCGLPEQKLRCELLGQGNRVPVCAWCRGNGRNGSVQSCLLRPLPPRPRGRRFHWVTSLGTGGLWEKSIYPSWYLRAGIPQMSRSIDNRRRPPEPAALCPSQAAPNP